MYFWQWEQMMMPLAVHCGSRLVARLRKAMSTNLLKCYQAQLKEQNAQAFQS
jgi:hypothetical protein